MTLWTIQTVDWYEKLLREGVISGRREYITRDWEFCLFGYHWLMGKMDERIGKRPFPECYPIWAWYQHLNVNRKRPDLRSAGFFPRGTKAVRVEIQKKESEVLLSDFMLWTLPFAYPSFIGRDENESVAFDNILANKGLDRTSFGKLPKKFQNEIVKSWDRVLDMDFEDPYYTRPKDAKIIQATFWSLTINEVSTVDEFVAR